MIQVKRGFGMCVEMKIFLCVFVTPSLSHPIILPARTGECDTLIKATARLLTNSLNFVEIQTKARLVKQDLFFPLLTPLHF